MRIICCVLESVPPSPATELTRIQQPLSSDVSRSGGGRARLLPASTAAPLRKYVVANLANSTRPRSVTAMAAATATLRVPNSAASVNRSRRSAVTSAAVIQPAPIEHTTNAAASGTVVDTPPMKDCGSSRITSSSIMAMPANASCCNAVRWRSANAWRALPDPHAERDGQRRASIPIGSEEQRHRSGELERPAEGELEPTADRRNGHARRQARESSRA